MISVNLATEYYNMSGWNKYTTPLQSITGVI